ncbi:phosphate/phosphite/phosphonate ABC transporter substrate-binding protein [Roseibium polysiphoniae]|uniref:Phosphate/phosphite/phosphonate ABC transporter substrate-binding protein n=1 Tax=Roseibium polysiphoniae TaxID=2571221 RepID=A0A944GT83_9HYPH|nr:phosphate/phosphite/phosphonate ABC transporter substrate-binding protein [Roseibium polysiphoniae]MBS8261608.1 phosphate/phosphite/phosphonate ABC transporter substrate-binding protein [Roseibium polysiphoniae]
MFRRLAIGLLAGLTMALTAASAEDYNPDTLKVALLPDENAATVIQNNEGLADYLENALGKKIELIVTTDYSSMIEAMRFGRIDVAYFGPASYTIAKDKMKGGDLDIEPFAARLKGGSTTYQSVLIANADSQIEKVEDIKGSGIELAYGDQASTSSHFAPKYMLLKAGVKVEDDYKQNFLGAHDAVAVNVARGNAAVGGLSRPILESMLEKGTIDAAQIRILGYSDPIPQYPWVLRTDLNEDVITTLKAAFYNLEKGNEAHDAVLKPFKSDGFAAIKDEDYDIIREIRANVQ